MTSVSRTSGASISSNRYSFVSHLNDGGIAVRGHRVGDGSDE